MQRSVLLLSLVLLLLWSWSYGQSGDWAVECVDCPKQFSEMTDRSLRLDTDGRPHIVYGEDRLYYAWFDGISWQLETPDDTPRVGRYASVAIDASGSPHISYQNGYGGGLKYARMGQEGWEIEQVDPAGAEYTSIDVTAEGYPQISYWDHINGDLKYAFRGETGWRVETIDSKGMVGNGASLATDGGGHPHISYCDSERRRLKYAHHDGSGWYIQIADHDVDIGSHSSLAVGLDQSIHITYNDWISGEIKYAYRPNPQGSWYAETVCELITKYPFLSIALDSNGFPHIGYSEMGNLWHAFRDEDGWHIIVLDQESSVGKYCSVAIHDDNTLHASYYDYSNQQLKHLRFTYDETVVQVVDAARSAGRGGSIAVDANNLPRISYIDGAPNSDLRYAHDNGSEWHIEVVDTAGIGSRTSLAVDSEGNAHVAYNDGAEDDLKYAHRDQTGWQVITVDSNGSVGHWPSLALDGSGFPHVSHSDWGANHNLKYAYRDETGWHNEIVDESWLVGWRNAIAVDGAGRPHIVYIPFVSMDFLKYAYRDGALWHIEVIADGEFEEVSIAVDDSNNPHVVYSTWDNDALVYTRKIGEEWQTEVVDTNIGMLTFPSIVMDADGYPHISYACGNPDYDIMYARKDATGWHLSVADGEAYPMWETSLIVDSTGRPHISYFNFVLEDLQYAHFVGPVPMILYWDILGSDMQISWDMVPEASAYWVYGASNAPHFGPGPAPGFEYRLDVLPVGTTTWISPYPIGDPENNWAYLVMAVDEGEAEQARSNRVGEFDVECEIP